jgi:RNase H-like domain found in reverse transcriptase/Reverse transcriptase (RNA-dependent DNA polymerase)
MFFVADITSDDLILGYPFFEDANPSILWKEGKLKGTLMLATIQTTEEHRDTIPLWLQKVTTATQLAAEEAAKKKKRTWDEIVPKRYHRYGRIFQEEASKRFPAPWKWDHAIDLKEDAPSSIDCRIYPLSPKEKEAQHAFIKENLRLKRIRRSKSPYASGFFFVQKKDGKLQPVQDYCNLNKWTVPNKYPLPLIPDLIHSIARKMLFTKFNVRWGHNNIPIKPGNEWKAAFKTSEGLFKPTVMFFGLTNSPATFQTMMDDIFQEEIAQGWVKIYMDDIIIATEDDEEEHTRHVNQVLKKLEEHDLYLKPEKCNFHVKEVEYLGIVIGQGQVKMDPTKVKGITEWPVLTSVKDVQSFLGFCNFYRVFIPHFSDISQPLNNLTCKNQQWEWTEREQQAFQSLKDTCTALPALHCPNWSKQFILETDALGYALGAVISQEFDDGIYPIAFHSRSLLPAEKNYDTHDKELAAVLFGFKCGRPLFLGTAHPIEVYTNHKNLQYFCQPQKITGQQAC